MNKFIQVNKLMKFMVSKRGVKNFIAEVVTFMNIKSGGEISENEIFNKSLIGEITSCNQTKTEEAI